MQIQSTLAKIGVFGSGLISGVLLAYALYISTPSVYAQSTDTWVIEGVLAEPARPPEGQVYVLADRKRGVVCYVSAKSILGCAK